MTEDLIAQIRAYSQQIAEEMIPVESDEGIPVVVAQQVFHPHLRPTRPRWVFGLAAVIALFLFGLVVSLLRWSQAPPVATSDRILPTVDTPIPSQGSASGWVAFPSYQGEWNGEQDIFLVGEGRTARRIIGSDSDGLDQMCPAFSPDGARLAYGQAEGTTKDGHTEGALVISDLDPAGNASVALEIETGATSAPPCPIWSPDGRRIAVGVHEGARVPQGLPGADGDVWIVDLDGGQTTVLSGMYVATDLMGPWFTDMEWSPDGTELAISNGQVNIYSTLTGELRNLGFSGGAGGLSQDNPPEGLTWSPDGTRIAFQYDAVILVAGVDDGAIDVLADGVNSDGIGPVWSPTGDRIVYQRQCHTYVSTDSPAQPCHGEQQDVVLVTPDGSEVVLPHLRMPGAEETDIWWPLRVTWSPDGQQLLYLAWPSPPVDDSTSALVAVPIDPNLPPVMLHEDQWISVYAEGFQLGFQTWGRQVSP